MKNIIIIASLFLLISSCAKEKKPSLLQNKPNTTARTQGFDNNEFEDIKGKLVELEDGERVIVKGMIPNHPYFSLVNYNGTDIYVETRTLAYLDAIFFQDEKEIEYDYCDYENRHLMTVYSKCTKESKYFILEKGEVELHKIKGVNDWLYLTKGYYVDNEVYGFVYLYDISEKSFYGEDIEEKKTVGRLLG